MSFKKMCKLLACCNPRSNNRVVPTDLAAAVARDEEAPEQVLHPVEAPKVGRRKVLRNYAGTMGQAINVLRMTPPPSMVEEEPAAPALPRVI